MRRLFTLFTLVAVALVFAAPAEAQFARGGIQGEATDPDGVPLPGVTVTLTNPATGASRTVVTGATGGYVLQGLSSGTYTIVFTLQGFQTVEQLGIEVHVGESPSVNVQMVLSSLEETVTVTAQTPMVEVTSKQVGGSISANEIENLPSINRSFILFSSLLPGVVARMGTGTLSADVVYVNGQDDNNSQFNIDGAANDDDQNGGNAGGQVRAAFEAMEEFQVLTSSFDAEFGRSMGGVINAVTKSGTNEFHGVAFYYAQRSDWNSTPFFTERQSIEQPKVSFNGEGFTVGGPIIRDKTHFFVSFEHLAPNRPVVNNFSSIGRDELSFASAEENNVWNWVLKVDHQINQNNKFTARLLWEYQPQQNSGGCGDCTQENLTDEEDYDWTFVTSVDSVLGDTKFNNLRVSFTREDLDFLMKKVNTTCDRSDPLLTFDCIRAFEPALYYDDLIAGDRGNQSRRRNNSLQFDDTLSWYLPDHKGDHDLRMGVQIRQQQVDRDSSSLANGRFRFDTNREFDFDDLTTYPEEFDVMVNGPRGVTAAQDLPETYTAGLFFQDDWQPISNFTLNLGVRWDWETVTTGDTNNIAPRLGFAWDPRGDGRTTVRAGAGRFYSRYLHGEWEDPLQNGVYDTTGIIRGWTNGDDDQQEFIDQMAISGCDGLTCLRDYLRDLMEAEIALRGVNTGSIDVEGSHLGLRTQPFADTLSVGVEHEVRDNLSIGVDVVRTQAKNQIIRTNLNLESNTLCGVNASGPCSDGRPNISIFNGAQQNFGTIRMDASTGLDTTTTHTSLLFSLRKRMSMTAIGRLSGRVSYTLSRSNGNVDNAAYAFTPYFARFSTTGWNFDNEQVLGEAPNNSNQGLEVAENSDRSVQWYRVHNFVVSGSWTVPRTSWRDNGGVVLSGIFRIISGDRTGIYIDEEMDNGNDKLAPEGNYSFDPANNPDDSDIGFTDVPFSGKFNGVKRPTAKTVDFSVRYRVPFGSRGWFATLSLDVFNLGNRNNFSSLGDDDLGDNGFMVPSNAFPNRQIQLGAKFTY